MKSYIILLRGLTPKGKNHVPMAPLRAALEVSDLHEVQTYIQSGNVLARSELPSAQLEQLVRHLIAREFGGDIAVLVRTPLQIEKQMASSPFVNDDPTKLYYTLLANIPSAQCVKNLIATDFSPDTVRVVNDMAYVRVATRYSDSKLNNNYLERQLKVTATTRVHRTMQRLLEMANVN
jgi:uncharacterized protein (DUF1697 family)